MKRFLIAMAIASASFYGYAAYRTLEPLLKIAGAVT